jgi:hypothetical protein
LLAGCRGGGADVSHRGAAGGAIQLVSARRIRVLDGAAAGVILVGGGGGRGAGLGIEDPETEPPQPGSGGGGSGGGILLEAPVVVMEPSTALLAAGGGGGGAGLCGARDAADAPPDGSTPLGGRCPPEPDVPPDGYTPPAGGDGAGQQPAQRGDDLGFSAGSGGGGHGRIRINSAFGTYGGEADALIRGMLTTGSVGRR